MRCPTCQESERGRELSTKRIFNSIRTNCITKCTGNKIVTIYGVSSINLDFLFGEKERDVTTRVTNN